MPLDLTWIDMIHTKLVLTYGRRFSDQYAGLQPEQVKADWAHELEGLSREGIFHALQNLPKDHPPNVLQFRAICASRPGPSRVHVALRPPDGKPPTSEQRERLRAALERMGVPEDPMRWARRLREREQRGEFLSRVQRAAWREALNTTELYDEEPTQ